MLKDNTKSKDPMKRIVFLLPLLVMGFGMAYAEPLDNIQTTVLDYSNSTASVEISWNSEENVSSYQIGCVSCFPNTIESTTENSIVIHDVTPFPNGSIAMLYGIAYDAENQILVAKQIFVNLID